MKLSERHCGAHGSESSCVQAASSQGVKFQKKFFLVKLGRMTSLQKTYGGVRGCGWTCVSEVGWSPQQFAEQGQAATHPIQCTRSTLAGTEYVAHVVRAFKSCTAITLTQLTACGLSSFLQRNSIFSLPFVNTVSMK